MKQELRNEKLEFIWRIASAHTIAYFIAGILALVFMNYKDVFAAETISAIMRPVESPWVVLGAGLQIFRGIIIALVLLPFKETFISKNGWIKFAVLILGLSYVSTIGPTFGSFEGYIYTKMPLQYHLLGIPEALIYTFLLTFIISIWYRKQSKALNIISIVLVALIILMSLLGLLSNLGIIKT